MAKKPIKITKEDLQHDEILDATDHAVFFLKAHANKILLVASIILAVYAVTVFLHQRKENRLAQASDEYFTALQEFDKALGGNPWATPERTAGMKKVVEMSKLIVDNYSDTEVARNALFLQGNAYYFAGDLLGTTVNTQEAIKVFQQYAERAKAEGDGFEQAAATLALGYAHENLHLLQLPSNPQAAQEALTTAGVYYDDTIKNPQAGFLKYEAMNAQGRLLEYLNRRDEARALFEQVVREHYRKVAEPEGEATQRQQLMYQLRTLANQFTAGNSAVIALRQMGVDVDALLKEVEGIDKKEGGKS